LEFCPKSAERKNVSIDVGTAGSVTLVLQTLMIPASVSQEGLVFEIRGGTHVAWSPTTGYFRHVFCEFLKKMGISASSETLSYGFYPKGGGGIRVKVKPARRILPLSLTERGEPLEMEIWSCASRDLQKGRVAERQADQAESVLGSAKKSIKYVPSASTGSAITIASNFASCVLGASSLGERGKAAERVGDEAATLMKRQLDSGACLDEWMADQILPYIALAEKRSRIRVAEITQHAETNMRVIEKFLPVEFSTKDNGKNFIISCETS
jgi:RNA 3'-terminal phosphate cyclase (ATP)/RNA 3'-terminal phosphate cyclase (GTP)